MCSEGLPHIGHETSRRMLNPLVRCLNPKIGPSYNKGLRFKGPVLKGRNSVSTNEKYDGLIRVGMNVFGRIFFEIYYI